MFVRLLIDMLPYQRLYQASDQRLVRPVVNDTARKMVVVPLLEFAVGLLLLTGLFTKVALIAGAFVMIALVFGTTLIENCDAITSQLIHAAFFAVLLQFVQYNTYALDNLLKR